MSSEMNNFNRQDQSLKLVSHWPFADQFYHFGQAMSARIYLLYISNGESI